MRRLRGIYYGWWVLAATFAVWVLAGGLFHNSAPILFGPIRDDLRLNSTQASIVFGMQRAEGSIAGPIVGPLVDRFGSMPLIIIGGVMAGVGYIILHWTHNYWLFMLVFVGVVSVGRSAGLGGHPLMSAINRWFHRRLSLAMSISTTGSTVGGIVLLPLVTLGVHTVGWRDVLLYAGIFTVFAIIPLGLLVRHSPERMGLRLEGARPVEGLGAGSEPQGEGQSQRDSGDFTAREVLKTRIWWVLLIATTLGVGVQGAISLHSVQMMVWKGMDEKTAGFMITAMWSMAIPIRIGIGALGMRVPLHLLSFAGRVSAGMALLALLLLDGTLGIVAFIVLLAVGEGGGMLAFVALGLLFGRRSYGTLMGFMSSTINVGLMLSPILAGRIVDTHDGDYSLALIAFIPFYLTAALLYLYMGNPRTGPPRRSTA